MMENRISAGNGFVNLFRKAFKEDDAILIRDILKAENIECFMCYVTDNSGSFVKGIKLAVKEECLEEAKDILRMYRKSDEVYAEFIGGFWNCSGRIN